LALLLLASAAYGMIAIARYGTAFPTLVEEVRYQYLSPAILAVLFCLVLCVLMNRISVNIIRYGRISYLVWLALLIVPYAMGPLSAVGDRGSSIQTNVFL